MNITVSFTGKFYSFKEAVKELNKFVDANIEELKRISEKVKNNPNTSSSATNLENAINELESKKGDIEDLRDAYQMVADEDNITDNLKKYISDTKDTLSVRYTLLINFNKCCNQMNNFYSTI